MMALDPLLVSQLPPELAIDLALSRLLAMAEEIIQEFSPKAMLNILLALDLHRTFSLPSDFALALQHQKEELPDPAIGKENLQIWWQNQGQNWVEQLKRTILFYRYQGYEMGLNLALSEPIEAYLQINQFFLDCALHAPHLDIEWLHSLQANLLLPVQE